MSASRNARRKTRSGRYVLGAAIGLVALGAGSLPAAATDAITPEEGITEWTSKDAGESGGRELPSVSADGRWVAFVGRGEGQGVWLAAPEFRIEVTPGELERVLEGACAVLKRRRMRGLIDVVIERGARSIEVDCGRR